MIAYCSIFRIVCLVVPVFGAERFYLKCSRLNAALQCSTFRNNTVRSRTIAFPCERGLYLRESQPEDITIQELNFLSNSKKLPRVVFHEAVDRIVHVGFFHPGNKTIESTF